MDVSLVLCEHRCGQDQGPKLKGVQAPTCVPAWAYCKMETFATSHAAPWMGFLLVGSVSLWDPAIDGASQQGLPKALLFAAAFTSTLEPQPGLPRQLLLLSFVSRRQAQAGHLHQLLCFSKAAQAEACSSSSSVLLLYPSCGCIKCFGLQGHQPGSFPQH